MRHRLYYLHPDIDSARRTLDELLLARIEERHIRFMTDGRPLPEDLPEASIFHKTDVLHGAAFGMLCGVGLGIGLAFLLVSYLELKDISAVVFLGSTLLGMLFGGWAASMVGAAIPNSQLQKFQSELQRGKLLLIVDVPARRILQIEEILQQKHPEMQFCGEDTHRPVFP
jgi:hypothetical protein